VDDGDGKEGQIGVLLFSSPKGIGIENEDDEEEDEWEGLLLPTLGAKNGSD
jgi:hypothetical protein